MEDICPVHKRLHPLRGRRHHFLLSEQGSCNAGWTHLAFPWNAFYKAPGEGAWVPHTLLTCTWGYVAWWTCSCWFLTAAFATFMLRNGMLN